MVLVLSIFPGGGLLDYAFEAEGFCIVRGPDPLWGGDVRRFHPPAGRFDGIIGGDPCQSHSSLANLVRARGLEPSFPDLSPEYERVVNEAQPAWFLRENVPQAPPIAPHGYSVRSFLLDNCTLDSGDGTGNEQMRRRRFWFGVRDGSAPELRAHLRFALFELDDPMPTVQGGHDYAPGQRDRFETPAVAGDARSVPVALGGSGKRKATAVGGHDGTADSIQGYRRARKQMAVTQRADSARGDVLERRSEKAAPVTGRNEGRVGGPGVDYSPPRRSLEEMLRLQGLPPDWLKHQPWTMQAKRKIVGNGVPVTMGRELARAIRAALYEEAA